MAPTIPAWCAPPEPFLGRDALVRQVFALVEDGPVTLVGAPGVGTTTMAGAVVQALCDAERCDHIAAIAIDASAGQADLVLALGQSLGAALPGDETSVLEVLGREHTIVVVDDADLAPEAVRQLVELAPSTTWILTGRDPVLGQAIPVPPLGDEHILKLVPEGRVVSQCRGRPLLALLAPEIEPRGDWAGELVAANPTIGHLADLPSGLPDGELLGGPFDPAAVRIVDGRMLPTRSLREALRRPVGPDPAALAATFHRHIDVLHTLACDLVVHTNPMDLRALRAATFTVEEPALRALAAACAARIHLRTFQASNALDLVRRTLQGSRMPHVARGLLKWVEGDALLTQGSDDLAHEAHLSAASELRGEGSTMPRTALARRCADAWVSRADRVRAQKWITLARSELARNPDPRALADTLRINGNLAAQAGELVGARALYEEALLTLAEVEVAGRERAFVRVGLAALATSDRAFPLANEHLDTAAEEAGHHPLALAAIAWRRAEIALRRGRRDQARAALSKAHANFRLAGSLRGLLLCARMEGDLAAVSGERLAAVQAWDQATALCVRTRNVAGLRRILQRRLVVEREGLPGPHLGELQQHLDRAEVLLNAG